MTSLGQRDASADSYKSEASYMQEARLMAGVSGEKQNDRQRRKIGID